MTDFPARCPSCGAPIDRIEEEGPCDYGQYKCGRWAVVDNGILRFGVPTSICLHPELGEEYIEFNVTE